MPCFWADGLLWVAKIALTDMHGGSLTPIDELTDESLRGNLSKFAPNWDGSEKLWRHTGPELQEITALAMRRGVNKLGVEFIDDAAGRKDRRRVNIIGV
ncbi:hypothetical protein TA5114_01080 [Cognatishimia activa]|uniref:Uncharacterized protein n=1 Tax=Cognatishimia activa TaxID=1715691 RepID=A0A0P1INX0_9RHOB|nr:hypothetical protein TA5113_02851 [Cognatishimia activa]CUK25282.1 hypothetical protein TA5114_01080 [Cognatishimia activa]